MKKFKSIIGIMALFACLFISPKSEAQIAGPYAMRAQTANGTLKAVGIPDTTVNTDTTYLVANTNSDGSVLSFGDVIYEWSCVPSITGTTTGTVIVQGSMTGTYAVVGDWVTLISDVTQYNSPSSISVSGSTALVNYFIFPRCQYKYTRIRFISAGTQTSVMNAKFWLRPHG